MDDKDNVLSLIEEGALVKFTQDLIRIKSVFNPDKQDENEQIVATYIYDFLKAEGFETYIQQVTPERPNVIAILNGESAGKTILFEGHTDVVTAGNLDEWTVNPFGGEITDGKIYGRGACDTKGNLAAAIFAVKAIKDSKIDFPGKIILCIPCDEEGMMLGIKDFIKNGWAGDVDGAIICEPEENQICLYQKGAMRIEITVFGKQAHGCMPLEGINPNIRMAKLILNLDKLERKYISKTKKHEFLGYPSITPTILLSPKKGERQINVVPSEAYVTLDIRTIPGQNHTKIIEDINYIFKVMGNADKYFSAEINILDDRPCTETSETEEISLAAMEAFKEVTGKNPTINGVPGATDGTFLNSICKIPVVVTGGGGRTIPHQCDEFIGIKELVLTSKIYAATALNFLIKND